MAYTKKTTTNTQNESVRKTTTTSTPEVKYRADDLIPCISMTKGELLLVGKKTRELYVWADYGDVMEVEYQDLLALKAAKSAFLYKVLFMVDDENLLNTPKWKDVKSLYTNIYNNDIEKLIDMSPTKFRQIFPTLPEGLKKALTIEISSRIENGTFDSLQKVRLIDELYNTDLISML